MSTEQLMAEDEILMAADAYVTYGKYPGWGANIQLESFTAGAKWAFQQLEQQTKQLREDFEVLKAAVAEGSALYDAFVLKQLREERDKAVEILESVGAYFRDYGVCAPVWAGAQEMLVFLNQLNQQNEG